MAFRTGDTKRRNRKEVSVSKKKNKWREIVGGEILATGFFSRQMKLIVLIMLLTMVYIQNRYAYQAQIIKLDNLKKELTDIKYEALTRSSELMERSRQSKIEEYIQKEQSDLEIATTPPFLIK